MTPNISNTLQFPIYPPNSAFCDPFIWRNLVNERWKIAPYSEETIIKACSEAINSRVRILEQNKLGSIAGSCEIKCLNYYGLEMDCGWDFWITLGEAVLSLISSESKIILLLQALSSIKGSVECGSDIFDLEPNLRDELQKDDPSGRAVFQMMTNTITSVDCMGAVLEMVEEDAKYSIPLLGEGLSFLEVLLAAEDACIIRRIYE